MVCFRYIIVNTLHRGDKKHKNKNNNNGDDDNGGGGDDIMKLRLNFIIFVKVLHIIQNVDVIKLYKFYSK